MSRKLDEKRERRLAEERRRAELRRAARRRNYTTLAVALLVAGAVVGAIVYQQQGATGPSAEPIGVPASEAGCGEVEQFENQGTDHIQQGDPHAPYNSDPPTSGPHIGDPPGSDARFFTDAVQSELLIHNLEHGQVVIWYNPDLSQETKDQIRAYVERENRDPQGRVEPLLAAPYEGLDDNYTIAAWTKLQRCEEFSSAAVDEFRDDHQGKTHEPLAGEFNLE